MSTIETHGAATKAVIDTFDRYVVPNYRRFPICLERGVGSKVWDAEGREYLDLFPGWGCNLLGHCPAPVVKAVQEQIARLIHVPNTWYTEAQGEWARLLSERSFGGQAFFCNSGTEANEAAIKLIRLRTDGVKYKVITFRGGFHGRTFGAVTATAQPKYHEGLGPMLSGFQYAPHGDLDAVAQLVDDHTGGILIEPILGEGGIVPAPPGFLEGLRRICDERDLVLAFDEVQSGCGRTGEWFGYQHFGVRPDVITLAKSLCAGVAGGAMLTTPELARHLRPGMHASTFGGNPIAAAAGVAALRGKSQHRGGEHPALLRQPEGGPTRAARARQPRGAVAEERDGPAVNANNESGGQCPRTSRARPGSLGPSREKHCLLRRFGGPFRPSS
jgi:acetylornithine/succinyldiaminopimelate/putrescine aminotransferase